MSERRIIIEGSGRHVHLSQEMLETLFGAGFQLEVKKTLSQPYEFVSASRVDVSGPRGTICDVAVLGPCRAITQVELSYTDARIVGLACPLRESGNLDGSAGCTLTGPAGSVTLEQGAIIAKRHIHLSPQDAARFGISDGEIVRVKVDGERGLIFDEVVCRVRADYLTFMHIDYDECNAIGGTVCCEITGEILKKR